MKIETQNRMMLVFRNEAGSTAVEYAMIIGVIVSLVCGSVFFLGSRSHETFHLVSKVTSLSNHNLSTNRNDQKESKSTSIASNVDATPEHNIESDDIISSITAQRLVFIVIAALMVSILCYSIRLRRVVRKHNDFHGLPVSSEQLQAAEQRKFAKRQVILQTLEYELDSLFNNEMDVRQLMTQPVNYVLPSSRTTDVRKLMKQDNVRHYPVCDKSGRLVGILSDRDILASDAKYVSECMTTNICTVRSDSKVSPAITMMFNHGISSLPIVDDGKLVGLLTTTDLVMTLQCTLQILQKSEAGIDLHLGTQPNAFPVKFQPPVLKS